MSVTVVGSSRRFFKGTKDMACSFGWWLVLICSEIKVLLVTSEWFVLREKYCWLLMTGLF
jgi:hypothetical protein